MTQLALTLRDTGISKAYAHAGQDWQEAALQGLREYCRIKKELRTEDFRLWWTTHCGWNPHDHHAWAGLFRAAVAKKIIRATGRFVMADSPATHSHRVQLYNSIFLEGA